MSYLLAFLFSLSAHAATELKVIDVEYIQPADLGSCGLLRAREVEREKVIRELIYLNRLAQKGRASALLHANHLLVNKLFMPKETWQDLNAEAIVSAEIPEEMKAEIGRLGIERVFLTTKAPGFVWQSFLYQTPPEMGVSVDLAAGILQVRYKTYLTVFCQPQLTAPRLVWTPEAEAPNQPNFRPLFDAVLFMLRK